MAFLYTIPEFYVALFTLRLVEDLLNWLPPRRLAGLGAHCTRHETLLPGICHLPPFSHTRVLCHLFHVATVIRADVFERGEENVALIIVENAVYTSDQSLLQLPCRNTSG